MDVLQNNVVMLFTKPFGKSSMFGWRTSAENPHHPAAKWLTLLPEILTDAGYKVILNNYGYAFQNPRYPIGLVGSPAVLNGWSLPNPALLGPCLFTDPQDAPDLMEDHRYIRYLVTDKQVEAALAPVYGNKLAVWPISTNMLDSAEQYARHYRQIARQYLQTMSPIIPQASTND